MIVVEFTQPAPLMSLNDRHHWSARAALTKAWRTATWAAACSNRHAHFLPPSTVTLHLPVRDLRRRDPHNFVPTLKACVDGLVSAGFWSDDTPEFVSTAEPVLVVRRDGLVRIEVAAR